MVKLQIYQIDKEMDSPSYARESDAAFDLRSREEVVMQPGDRKIIKSGLKMAIPPGYVGLIRDRSSMVTKGKTLHTMAGVIDSGYRGEVGIVMKNLHDEPYTIEKNERIAQMLIQPVEQADIELVEELDENTERGTGGFGHTGRF